MTVHVGSRFGSQPERFEQQRETQLSDANAEPYSEWETLADARAERGCWSVTWPACRLGGLSSAGCCVLSSRCRARRWWSAAAGTPWDKLRGHAQRTARAWSLDGQPLLGISVFAVLGITLEELLARRFASFRTIYLPAAGELRERGFELLATGQRPHYTILLHRADDRELEELLAALGAARHNPQYGRSSIWREEGRDVPG